jgi:2-polyprenyl-3-methyl-5-hydroxy-6-metoxy-1,4-benzoquinol methylase
MFHVEQPVQQPSFKCPSCGHNNYVTHLVLKDYFLSKEVFSIIKCTECGLLSTYPQPLPSEISKYYKSAHYISHATENKGLEAVIYNFIRKKTLASKTALIRKYSSGNKLLDIGCATGVFVDYCQRHGFVAEGIEPDEKSRNYANNILHLEVNDLDYISKLPEKSFDVITMWHVLEHVNDIQERMKVVNKLLADNGTAFIALPNPLSYDAQFYKEHWAAYDVPRHLYHFTNSSFTSFSVQQKMKIIKTVPMVFDAYYISLLSERYINGKGSYLKAFYRGFISNLYARRHSMNYSSLIYILKKA